MKIYKIVFFNSMILGTLIAISSYSWLSMWMGLEINLLSIIPLFSSKMNIFASESSLKYFITQAMASLILLMSVMMLLLTNEFINPLMSFHLSMMMNSALLMKMGAAPFHFWFPEVMEGLNWLNCLILLSWQKIAPMMLLMNSNINTNFITAIIISNLIISTIMGFNQMSLRKILAFSSINHMAWMMASIMISYSAWFIYFLIYSLINFNIIMIFNITKSYFLNQINSIMNYSKMVKFSFMTNFLSLGGLPPFLGFLPKWIVINWMSNNGLYYLTFLMIVMTLIMMFIYIRTIMSSMTMSLTEMKIKNSLFNNYFLISINIITGMGLITCTFLTNLI